MPTVTLLATLEQAFGPAHPEPRPGRYERLVRPADVPAEHKGVLLRMGRPVARGVWPVCERAAGYAAR